MLIVHVSCPHLKSRLTKVSRFHYVVWNMRVLEGSYSKPARWPKFVSHDAKEWNWGQKKRTAERFIKQKLQRVRRGPKSAWPLRLSREWVILCRKKLQVTWDQTKTNLVVLLSTLHIHYVELLHIHYWVRFLCKV